MSEQDFMPIQNFDYLEFYVGDAKHAAYYLSHAWGFTPIAYAGWKQAYVIAAAMCLNRAMSDSSSPQPLGPEGDIAEHVKLHGDGVKSIALRVDDAERAYREATSRGAHGVQEPRVRKDDYGTVKTSAIAIYGDTILPSLSGRTIKVRLHARVPTSEHECSAPCSTGGPGRHRPRCGQCRTGQNERVGRFL